MPGYTREELGRIANAVRNVWASCYNGGFIQGMTKSINSTGAEAFLGLQGDVIEIIGSDSIFSGIPLTAIIAMGPEGVEEALRIQNGYGPFDMKPGFLKSPKAKTNKEGKKYIAIPFRHMTPGATGPGKKMSPSVHKAAMKKVDQGVKFSDQLGTKEDPSDFGMVNSRGYEWQNGPYAGMVNIRDEKGKHSQYRTFRMISENSAPNAWWHPGVQSNDVVGAVVDYVQPYVKEGLKMAAKAEVVDKIYEIFKQT